MARDLFLEIGVEELPASYVPPAVEDLRAALERQLGEVRLSFDAGTVRTYATPRRIAIVCPGVAESQETRVRTVKGPPAKVAFAEDGSPTKAAIGFAKSQGVAVEALEVKDDYVRVEVTDEGRPAGDVLPDCLGAAVAAITFPKTMRWGTEARFGRPIRWIVALLGEDVLDFEYAGVRAGRETRGLRFWAPGPHAIGGPGDYLRVLEDAYVVADVAKRRRAIEEGIQREAVACGGTVIHDEGLLDEVTFLVECPTVFTGRFDERFIALPKDVIVAAMRGHQRYFAVETEGRGLLPFFLCVMNGPPDNVDGVRRGNERVLESRLADAEFYWKEDTKSPFESKVEALRNVVWLEGLGSLYEKTERLMRLARIVGERLGSDETATAERAARLAKADLVTEMVRDGKEFTELQGIMGREYATVSREPEGVATAIYEHYLPRFAGDDLPESIPGIILSMVDRIDSIVGCFSAGLVPTGSQDPYALRRQAIGLVRTIDEKGLTVSLGDLAREAARGFAEGDAPSSEVVSDVLGFVRQRARNFYIDAGYSYDLVDAVLEASFDNLVGVRPRIEALTHFRASEDFAGLVIGARRVVNILKGQGDPAHDGGALVEPSSKALDAASVEAERLVGEAIAGGDFDRAVRELLNLRKPIDTFFDDVMVMVDDESLKRARLGLLAKVRDLFLRIADFSKVVLEGEGTEDA
jgi:glycyl-tRNA synthetase beta chain